MSVLRNLEAKLADLVEGTFGRVFRSEVRPVELARKLAREMDEHKTVSVSRTYVPNEYVVWLSPQDRELFAEGVAKQGFFDLGSAPVFRDARAKYGFESGKSTHADRLATIRDTAQRCSTVIDTHTADGLKVAREHRDAGVPMIVLETALPAKFSATIVEALGREPDRPAALAGIEQLPKRFKVMPVDVAAVKQYIAQNG